MLAKYGSAPFVDYESIKNLGHPTIMGNSIRNVQDRAHLLLMPMTY